MWWWPYFTWTLLHLSFWLYLSLLQWLKIACGLRTWSRFNCIGHSSVIPFSVDEYWVIVKCQDIWKAVEELISGFNSHVSWPNQWHYFNTETKGDQDLYLDASSPLSFTCLCIFGDTGGTPASSTFCSPTCKYWSKRDAWEIDYSIQTLAQVKKYKQVWFSASYKNIRLASVYNSVQFTEQKQHF